MKIASSSVLLTSTSVPGHRSPDRDSAGAPDPTAPAATEARSAARAGGCSPVVGAGIQDGDELQLDPRTLLAKLLVEYLTGRKIKVMKLDTSGNGGAGTSAAPAAVSTGQPPRPLLGWSLDYRSSETTTSADWPASRRPASWSPRMANKRRSISASCSSGRKFPN